MTDTRMGAPVGGGATFGSVQPDALRERLTYAVEHAEAADLPGLAGALAEAQARLTLRLSNRAHETPRPDDSAGVEPGAARLLTVGEAAALARATETQVYRWARTTAGRRWARRLSRKCLRVDEARFKAFLAAGGGRTP